MENQDYNKKDYYIVRNEYGQTLFVGRLRQIRRRFRYAFGHLPILIIPTHATTLGFTITKTELRGASSYATRMPLVGKDVYNIDMGDFKEKIKELPHKPGVYLFKDKDARVLYVGKAKDLRNRVLQYFGHDNRPQLPYLMSEAVDLDYTVVGSELESLFLENTLIKQYLPPYNIKLRDDKNYAFIKIDYSSPIPQIGYARKIDASSKQATFFGPYSSARKIKHTLDFVRKIFPYCANREAGKRPCFYYYLHRCPGICIGAISMDEYLEQLKRIEQFLKGDTTTIKKDLQREMRQAAIKKMFEKAARLRDQLNSLQVLGERQTVMFAARVSWDFISVYEEYGDACVNLFKIREGKLIDKEDFIYQNGIVPKKITEEDAINPDLKETVLETFLETYYTETSDIPREIFVQNDTRNSQLVASLVHQRSKHKVPITVPSRGQKLKLITLGITNAQEYLKKWQANQATNLDAINQTLEELQKILSLPTLPRRIEGYDISNTQGTNPVSSMVVTKDGLPAKGEYRKFKIRIKSTPDDFAMMHETITRRLEHLPDRAKEGAKVWERPDLIVIDGGKGQLGAAMEAQQISNDKFLMSKSDELSPTPYILNPIPMIGLAKRIEEIFLPGNPEPIVLDHSHPALQLLQRLRDEAHRFGITFHRSLRSKAATKSALDTMPGIGPKTKKLLKQKFGTLAKIKQAPLEDLVNIVGKQKADIIKKYL